MLPAGAMLFHLCEPNITVPSLTPLCQKLCAQLVSSGALCPNKPAKNEHLGSDLPLVSPPHFSPSLYQQLPQWHRVTSLSDEDGISYIIHIYLELASCNLKKDPLLSGSGFDISDASA